MIDFEKQRVEMGDIWRRDEDGLAVCICENPGENIMWEKLTDENVRGWDPAEAFLATFTLEDRGLG